MNINLSKRLGLILFTGFAVVLILMAVTLAITIQNTSSVKQQSQGVLTSQIPQMLKLMNIDRQLFQSLNILNEYLISGEESDRQRFHFTLNQLTGWSKDQGFLAQIDQDFAAELDKLLISYSAKAYEVIRLRNDDQKNYQGISSAAELLNPYHLQFISLLDTLISSRLTENELEGNQEALVQMTSLRNSWLNMIMSLRVYFTTRSEKDYEQIFLYQQQNVIDMDRLVAIKGSMDFDELFVDQLVDLHKIYMTNLPKVLEFYQTEKWRMDTYIIRNEIYPIASKLRVLLASLVTKQEMLIAGETDLLTEKLDAMSTISKMAFILSFLVSILAIYIVSRSISRIVNELDKSRQDAVIRSELLQKSSLELAQSLEKLQKTQSQLIEHEKMAALGNLVAGMAHEINTPIGIGVMASSHMTDSTVILERKFEEGNMKKTDLVDFMKETREANQIMMTNLQRAADLIKSFKQIAVDQTSEELREFELYEYMQEIYNSLVPTFKKTRITVDINCIEFIKMTSYPGALAQVVTNLLQNSVLHGFDTDSVGNINLCAKKVDEDTVILTYEDDGKGMDAETLSKVFNPFYTTKRGQGGSGLGMHLLYNLVTQKLMGTVKVDSSPGKGVHFTISIPLKIKEKIPGESIS